MKKTFVFLGCIALAGAASAAAQPTSYGVAMTSDVQQGQYMAVYFEGTPVCFGEVSANGKPVVCKSVAHVPRMIRVSWGAPSGWVSPSGQEKALPPGWKMPEHAYRQVNLTHDEFYAPAWFRSGDDIVFTINRQHWLSITYQCHRPGHACGSYPPYTSYGVPQGVASVAP